ncbi:helix-turn-helix domain-containing protein [Pseudomonas sp. FW300-N2A2]|uniref:helix-turn-helix domain-containing protein n=1 Tax=Pseudomonas sp. FW300-N2A2 TaxID=2751316 RepID=UPI001A93033C|nr:helix-turn-helix transcriptional regulator [Pseudomonas sp. FW300-N2A2]
MTPEICKAARALARLTQRDLAFAADIATPTIADFERGARRPHVNNLKAIANVFEDLGIDFVVENEEIVGIDFRNLKSMDA